MKSDKKDRGSDISTLGDTDGHATGECDHSLRMGSLCALCGKEIAKNGRLMAALHTSDKVLQTPEAALKAQEAKNKKLRDEGKLILILDLDQTILHTTITERPCSFSFAIDGCKFYVKLRPYLRSFLKKACKLFEIHVYTMGAREYAQIICNRIDPDRHIFGDRIVSRSENFNEMHKRIDRITCMDDNVIILDDRADVWSFSENLVLVRPFWYYDRIDINDPARIGRMQRRSSDLRLMRKEDAKEIMAEEQRGLSAGPKDNDGTEASLPHRFANDLQNLAFDEKANKQFGIGLHESMASSEPSQPGNVADANDGPRAGAPNPERETEHPKDEAVAQLAGGILLDMIQTGVIESNEAQPAGTAIADVPMAGAKHKKNRRNRAASLKDAELPHIYRFLKRIHKKYFEGKKTTRTILRLRLLKNMSFICARAYAPLIESLGGQVVESDPQYAIEDARSAQRFKVVNLSLAWVYEGIYRRKLPDITGYIINDFREPDNYEKELLDEFF